MLLPTVILSEFLILYTSILRTSIPFFANSRNISVQQIAKQINKKYKKKITYVNRDSNISRMADNSKIKKFLNYNPKFTNKKIIMRMLSYHRKNIYI